MSRPTPSPRPSRPQSPSTPPAALAVHILLDRSGSMADIADDVVGGLNQLIALQRESDTAAACLVTLAQFDSHDPLEVVWANRPVATVPALSRADFVPRGSTPLYDAIALLLDRAERDGDKDTDHLVVVITDGQENASDTHSRASILARIATLSDRGWAFTYLSADPEAFADADSIGMASTNTEHWRKDAAGVAAMFDLAGKAVRHYAGKSRAQRHATSTTVIDDAKRLD